MIRFLHTSDWQLGMSRRFLAGEAQERFAAARLDAIRTIGALAERVGAQFIVVAGDVFETNQVSALTLQRAMDKLSSVKVPVFLLPGNHDPLDAASIFSQAAFLKAKPSCVHVLAEAVPVAVPGVAGVEVLGAPWRSKRPLEDLCARALHDAAPPAPGCVRILVGHGGIDVLKPGPESLASIGLQGLERAIEEGLCHYVALGDRHSSTAFGKREAVRYSGAPEPTDFDEDAAGLVLEVVCDANGTLEVTEHVVGTWCFLPLSAELTEASDIAALKERLDQIADKDRCIVRLALRGSLTIAEMSALGELLDEMRPRFAALHRHGDERELVLRADTLDVEALNLSGYALEAWRRLEREAEQGGPESATAAEALVLLHRLAREAEV